jgi:hypothetical protein
MKAQGLDADGNPLQPDAQSGQTVFDDSARKEEVPAESTRANPYADLRKEAKNRGTWEGFKRPKDKADRLRAGVPWKFRSGSPPCALGVGSDADTARGSFFGDF